MSDGAMHDAVEGGVRIVVGTDEAALLARFGASAFVSGAVLAGLLGWSLLRALQRAGVVGARPEAAPAHTSRAQGWTRAGVVAVLFVLAVSASYLTHARAGDKSGSKSPPPLVADGVAQIE